jgi:hypothetical protein
MEEGAAPALRAGRGALGAYAKELAERHPGRHAEGPSWSGAATRRCSTTSPATVRHRARSRCSAPTSSPPRTAPAWCTWRPASVRTTRTCATPPASPRCARWTSTVVHRRDPDWAGEHVFDANPRVIRHLKERGVVVRHDTYDHPYPHCWRCASRWCTGRSRRGSSRSPRSATAWSSSTSRSRWVPEHVKDGSFGKWLANARDWSISRNRFWGSPIPVWVSDDPEYPASTCTARSPSSSATSACRSPTCTARRSTTWCGPTPTTRPALDDAPGARGARLLVRVGVDAVRPGALPVRERRLVRAPLPGRLHRRVHRPDARLVLHAARAGHGAVRPAGVLHLREPRHRARRRRRARCPSRCATTPTRWRCSTAYGADAMRWYLLSSPILRGGDFAVTEQGIRDTVRHVILPLWNAWYFLTLYANAAGTTGAFRTDQTDVLDRYLLGELHDLVATPRRRWTTTTCTARADGERVPRDAHQLVHPPQPRPLLGGRAGRDRHAAHRARDALPGGGAAAAARDRARPPRAHRRPTACT